MSPRQQNSNLTSRQEEVLASIREELERRGAPPSYREIGERVGLRSTNGVKQILDTLERKGYLRRSAHRARAIELTPAALALEEQPKTGTPVPLIGRVAAGEPILALENLEGFVQFDPGMLRSGEHFALEVKGDSMVEAGILDGDLVCARVQESALTGEMVVAVIGDEATVKFYFPEGDGIRLQPANERYRPIRVDRDSGDFRIAGKVVALLRKF